MDKIGLTKKPAPAQVARKTKIAKKPTAKSQAPTTRKGESDQVTLTPLPPERAETTPKETAPQENSNNTPPQEQKESAAPTTLLMEDEHPALFVLNDPSGAKSEAPKTLEQQLQEMASARNDNLAGSLNVYDAIKGRFGENRPMTDLLTRFVGDDKHPTNLAANLKNPETRSEVLDELQALDSSPHPDTETFKKSVEDSKTSDSPLMQNCDRFNIREGKKSTEVLKEQLLAQDEVLFSTGPNPTPEQKKKLKAHARRLNRVMPKLSQDLEGLVSDMSPGSGFPTVSARTKNADGMVDKIQRMSRGNDGKAPRPDYSLADMPDALGARVVVKDAESLQKVMGRLEEKFGEGAIFEKDNFYSNPKKQARSPYRVVTYTVVKDGVPAEVQLTTLRASLAADLFHNTHYKPCHPDLGKESSDYVLGLHRAAAQTEHAELAGKAKS